VRIILMRYSPPLALLCLLTLAGPTLHAQIQPVVMAGGATKVSYIGSGADALTTFIAPNQLAIGPSGDIYFTDSCLIIKLTANARLSVVAGNGTCGLSGDGGPAVQAAINKHGGIAVDRSGNVYSQIRAIIGSAGSIQRGSSTHSQAREQPGLIFVKSDLRE
jgi:hypothetical protein